MSDFLNLDEIEASLDEHIKQADSGNNEMQEKLGIYYWTRADAYKAEKYLEMAARGGSVSAMVMLSKLHRHPPVIRTDDGCNFQEFEGSEEERWYWIEMAAENGDAQSMFDLATYYRGTDDPEMKERVVEWYFKAAEKGCVDAYNDIGTMYRNAVCLDRDYIKAFEWYVKGASHNCATAQLNLGRSYWHGEGVEQDHEKAIEYYTKAAEQGEPYPCYEVGLFYECRELEDILCDPSEAYKWYRRGAIGGNDYAIYGLARCYLYGLGVDVDYRKAFLLFYKIATREDPLPFAVNQLGVCYAEGYGVRRNRKRAFLWFKKGALLGDKSSMLNLAKCYENGVGTTKSLRKAELMRRMAENTNDKY